MLNTMLLRIATVMALRGQTLAGNRVFNSAIDPLQLLDKAPQPVIVIYTEEDKTVFSGQSLLSAPRQVTLAFHLLVASRVNTQDHGVTLHLADTDAGLETQLDTLRYQIATVLDVVNSPWAELWHSIVLSYHSEESRRGADNEGVKFAAREILLKLDLIANHPPQLGPLPADHVYARAIDLFTNEPDLAGVGNWLAAVLNSDVPASERQDMAARLGVSPSVIDVLQLGASVSGAMTVGDLSGNIVETISETIIADETISERLEPDSDG